MLGERIPLTKMEITQEPIREKQLQEKFLGEQPHSLSQNSHPDHKFSSHGLRNFQNVSVLGGWYSTAPPGGLA